jgi:hypothetical protein
MQAQRTFLLVLLALIVGIVLGWWICNKNKKTETIMETDYLVSDPGQPTQVAASGNIITWRRQDSGIDQFTITIPDGLCPSAPPFNENQGQGTMTATASNDEVIKCTVLDQSAAVPSTFPFNFYTHVVQQIQTPPPPPQPLKEEKKRSGSPTIYSPIAGSCQGCGSATGQTGLSQTPLAPGGPTKTVITLPTTLPPVTQPPYYITCSMDPTSGKYQASVAPIVIPSTQTVNQWKQSGQSAGWSVQFPSGQTPCSNGNTFQNTASCYLDGGAALNTPYSYTATLNQCPYGGSASSTTGTFTITQPAAH